MTQVCCCCALIIRSVHVQQPPCIFVPDLDNSYPGQFVAYADSPGYEWSTFGTSSLRGE